MITPPPMLSSFRFSRKQQADSIRHLAKEPFEWLLPGHGRRVRFQSEEERLRMVDEAASVMENWPSCRRGDASAYGI